jgi:hypothetical protein
VQLAGATAVGPLVLLVQLVAVYKLADVLPLAVQLATAVDGVLLVLQVVAIQFGDAAVTGVQDGTGVGPLKFVVLHVVFTQELPLVPTDGVQLATAVGPVLLGVQVVVIQPLADVGPLAVQLEAPVGPVGVTGQVVVV